MLALALPATTHPEILENSSQLQKSPSTIFPPNLVIGLTRNRILLVKLVVIGLTRNRIPLIE